MYDPLHEVCWHEAGHAIMAHNHGVACGILWVYQEPSGEWGGRHGSYRLTGEKGLDILAAGLAGSFLYLKSIGKESDENLIERAFLRALDDRKEYLLIQNEECLSSTFGKWCNARCVNILERRMNYMLSAVNELIQRNQIGPEVFRCIMEKAEITQDMRDQDDVLVKLHMRLAAHK